MCKILPSKRKEINDLMKCNIHDQKCNYFKGRCKLAWEFYKSNTSSVEINFKGVLQKNLFPIHPACRYVPDKEKERMISTIRLENISEKVMDIIQGHEEMNSLIDHIFN